MAFSENSFKLVPNINAVGVVDDPHFAIKLLLSCFHAEARRIAKRMLILNQERQQIEKNVMNDAMEQARSQEHQKALILIHREWHPAVMGNIGTRISSYFG